MLRKKPFAAPFVLPVASFAAAIIVGALLLGLEGSTQHSVPNGAVGFVDALFTATSSVCVTGLATVDPSTVYSRQGLCVMLGLMQLGGLGIVTYSSLVLYMFSRRVSLLDRLAVGQALLHDNAFHLGLFLKRVVVIVLCVELAGALLLFMMEPVRIGPFNAFFLAVSSFCNAGFAPWPDNLIQWRGHCGVNAVVMSLIVVGGLGFFVIDEVLRLTRARFAAPAPPVRATPDAPLHKQRGLSYPSRVVISTSFFLIAAGAIVIFAADLGNSAWKGVPMGERALAALFQSVTSRTAGFATADMASLSNLSLLCTIVLMFIGGSPGSCAGGIKTTSFRVLASFLVAQLRGHRQVVVAGRAVDAPTLNKAVLLLFYALLTSVVATLVLAATENGSAPHASAPFSLTDLYFEVVSALATVGLSVNLTPKLSDAGKIVLCVVMFIGRLGPIWLITTIQQFQEDRAYGYPEGDMPIG